LRKRNINPFKYTKSSTENRILIEEIQIWVGIESTTEQLKCCNTVEPVLWYLSSHDILEIRDYYATGVSWLNVIFFLPGKLKVLYKLYDVWCSVTWLLRYHTKIGDDQMFSTHLPDLITFLIKKNFLQLLGLPDL
jgi:hypothetical protein